MKKIYRTGLYRCALFRGLGDAEIENLVDSVDYKTIELGRRDVYSLDGDTCRNVDIVLRGMLVANMMAKSGRQMDIIRVGSGEIVAPCYMYGEVRSVPATLEAERDTTLMRMSLDTFRRLVDTNEKLRWNYVGILSDVATYLASRIGFLALLTVREKVVHYLRSQVMLQKRLSVTLDKSRQKIADMFAVQKYSLQRAIASLAADGIIRVEGKTVTVLDVRGLTL